MRPKLENRKLTSRARFRQRFADSVSYALVSHFAPSNFYPHSPKKVIFDFRVFGHRKTRKKTFMHHGTVLLFEVQHFPAPKTRTKTRKSKIKDTFSKIHSLGIEGLPQCIYIGGVALQTYDNLLALWLLVLVIKYPVVIGESIGLMAFPLGSRQ